jgi:exopolysaccharide biosynthesis WecB/TagA/CpsF family protein
MTIRAAQLGSYGEASDEAARAAQRAYAETAANALEGQAAKAADMLAGSRPTNIAIATIAGLPIAALNIRDTIALMLSAAAQRPRHRPFFMTSANGEVVTRYHTSREIAALFDRADVISADGQPLVIASRLLCTHPLPERVATTDLFWPAAEEAARLGLSFYFYGSTEDENRRAVETVAARIPTLRIVGRSHGYHCGADLERIVAEIDALAPDILWLGLGVPLEQDFAIRWRHSLTHVGVVKTCGGLFNFLSGRNARAPIWMQKVGLEWLFRLCLEPRRVFWRYLITSPKAVFQMIRRSR